jgi:hypothetical protein
MNSRCYQTWHGCQFLPDLRNRPLQRWILPVHSTLSVFCTACIYVGAHWCAQLLMARTRTPTSKWRMAHFWNSARNILSEPQIELCHGSLGVMEIKAFQMHVFNQPGTGHGNFDPRTWLFTDHNLIPVLPRSLENAVGYKWRSSVTFNGTIWWQNDGTNQWRGALPSQFGSHFCHDYMLQVHDFTRQHSRQVREMFVRWWSLEPHPFAAAWYQRCQIHLLGRKRHL